MKKILFIVAAIVMMAGCNGNKTATSEQAVEDTLTTDTIVPDERGYIVEVGDMAPNFTATIAGTDEQVSLAEYRNKRVVMLQFTASWCGVCRKEMPFIEKDIWLKHKDNPNFALIGIDRDEPVETVLKFAETTGVTYPLALDPGADIFAKYAVRDAGITRNVLIDKEGKIVMMTRLYKPEEFATLVQTIDEMLK